MAIAKLISPRHASERAQHFCVVLKLVECRTRNLLGLQKQQLRVKKYTEKRLKNRRQRIYNTVGPRHGHMGQRECSSRHSRRSSDTHWVKNNNGN